MVTRKLLFLTVIFVSFTIQSFASCSLVEDEAIEGGSPDALSSIFRTPPDWAKPSIRGVKISPP